MLAQRFASPESFRDSGSEGYHLLPFRFIQLDSDRYVASNLVGEYVVLERPALAALIDHRIDRSSEVYGELLTKHFLYEGSSTIARELLGLKYRTKLSRLSRFTGLHMFVVTLRCEHSCVYCQVSRQTEDKVAYDMSPETARKAVEFAFFSPSPTIKIEFQGGEPLLNMDAIRLIVEEAENRNKVENRDLSFVIATNLSLLTEDVLEFADQHNVYFSTSLDGPQPLHNANRPRRGKNSHELTLAGIRRIQDRFGPDRVSALMTTTATSLGMVGAIVDEYVHARLHEIFLRPMSPYGFAARGGHVDRYSADNWLAFWKAGLERVLEVNRRGYPMREVYSALVLQKILTPQNPGFVDLQSPAGLGIAGIIYNYDGSVYASDESRMIAETGDSRFRLGAVTDRYESVLGNEWLLDTLEESLAESAPLCSECAFVPYCGVDPIYHYETQRDVVGNKAVSGFCRRNMEIIRHLFLKLQDNAADAEILRQWVARC